MLDASVLANALADDGPDGVHTRERLAAVDRLVAPDLIDVEVLSVLRRRWLAAQLTDKRLELALDDLAVMPVERVSARHLTRRAAELKANITPYDGVYVALAELSDCPFLTADRKLVAAPGARCAFELVTG